ncbi:TRAP transporter large permease [Halopenitus persicus]|uniref:C4-dicarboxylate transporter, DctM subunit n=1 Tax=Halopenitus persicus TaxID=1048396 RepID=A0A1H3JX94_9EURY|nr:TRAP transporter large permease [Halopenitus persicus]QHS15727.1 TRAP transporter large permease [haloarchaeon 3A1-DGR]SDY44239.1 C4-dicarboxylate transporter, DctM subunit [Halopenitus persicus]
MNSILLFAFSPTEFLVGITILTVIAFILGIPIYLVFGLWALGYHVGFGSFPLINMSQNHYGVLQSFSFTAIPLFILVGDLIREAGIAENLVAFTREVIGWIPGVTGNTAIGTAAIFSAITGSNAATTASVGSALYSPLCEQGYDNDYAAATIASGGVLGAIIPPSLLLIIYGAAFGVSIVDLFLAGVIPGLGMLFALLATNTVIAYRNDYGVTDEFGIDPKQLLIKTWHAKVGLGTIVVLLGGIFLGIFTPSESASVAVVYILVAAIGSRQITSIDAIVRACYSSILLIGIILPMVVTSILIQQSLSDLGLQEAISNAIISLGNPVLIALVMTVIMLLAGSVLDGTPNMLLTAPMLSGAAASLGWSPVAWGIIFMMGASIGYITPPYGLNLYVISGIADIDYIKVAKAAKWHWAGFVVVWIGVMVWYTGAGGM